MSLFIPVTEPEDVRRDLLTAMKQSITALRKYEEFRKLRAQKLAAMHELVGHWNEIAKLMRKLKVELPKTDIRAVPSVREPMQAQPRPLQPASKPAAPVARSRSKVDLLEQQLEKIEQKLQGISTD
jgi:hypothetical protein